MEHVYLNIKATVTHFHQHIRYRLKTEKVFPRWFMRTVGVKLVFWFYVIDLTSRNHIRSSLAFIRARGHPFVLHTYHYFPWKSSNSISMFHYQSHSSFLSMHWLSGSIPRHISLTVAKFLLTSNVYQYILEPQSHYSTPCILMTILHWWSHGSYLNYKDNKNVYVSISKE